MKLEKQKNQRDKKTLLNLKEIYEVVRSKNTTFVN
jgi:hypothetical protein